MNKLNSKYIQVVYKGLIDKKSIRDISKDIRKITIAQKKDGLPYNLKQEKFVEKVAKKAQNKIKNEKSQTSTDISLLVYNLLKKDDTYTKMKSLSYEQAKKEETKAKEELFVEVGDDNFDYLIKIDWGDHKKAEDYVEKAKIFFLASSHDDCAVDHLECQGKMYIDERWEKMVKNNDAKKKIREYVNDNKIKTYQWVIGKPNWFITRPNCRHYFKKLSVDEVLSSSVKQLNEKYNMHSKIGGKSSQTIRHSTKKGWYTRENVENIIAKYEERLAYHKSLYEIEKNDELKNDIEKDKLLIKKWKSYLQNM